MVLVHAIDQGLAVPSLLSEVTMHWLRFAAGGFIFASGLCIGAIHYRKALDPARRGSIYVSLLRRAGLVLLVHYFATFLSLTLVPLHGFFTYETVDYVRDVLMLRTGYDLLLFYVVMLLASPVVIELARRIGALPVFLISAAVFFVSYDNPYVGLYSIENHFPVIRWQAVFVIGLLAGSKLKQFDALSLSAKRRLLTGAAITAIAIAALSALERSGSLTLPWWLTVTKFPLSPMEVTRYVSLVIAIGVGVDLLWSRVAGTRGQKIVQLVGAQSLLLWVVHVPILGNVVAMHWIVALLIAYAGVWFAARIAVFASKHWADAMPTLPRLPYAAPVIGSLIAVNLLTHLQQPPQIVHETQSVVDAELDDEEIPDIILDDVIPDGDEGTVDETA